MRDNQGFLVVYYYLRLIVDYLRLIVDYG
jgi:hypothetical protein